MSVVQSVRSAGSGLAAFDLLSKSLVAETKEQQSARVSKQADDDLNAYMAAHNLSDLNGVKALDIVKWRYPEMPEAQQRLRSIGYSLKLINNIYKKDLAAQMGSNKQPFEMTKEEFESANTHYATSSTGKTHKLGAYIEIKKEFSSEQELTDYVNANIAKGKSFETQLGYYKSMTYFNDVNYLTWDIDHNIIDQYGGEFNGFSVSARKKHEDFIKEAVRNGIDVPLEAIKSNSELSDRLLFHPKYVAENGVPVVTVNNYGAVRDVSGNEFYSFDLAPYDGEPLLKDSKAILDSATSESTIEKLARSVRVQKSGLYAMDVLDFLMKHITVGTKPIADLIDTSDYNSTFTRLTDRMHIETDATMALGMARIMNGIAQNQKHLGLSDDAVAYFHDNRPIVTVATDDYKKQLAIDAIEQGKGILSSVVGDADLEELKYHIEDIKKIPTIDEFINDILKDIQNSINTNNQQWRNADNEEDKRYFESAISQDVDRFNAL